MKAYQKKLIQEYFDLNDKIMRLEFSLNCEGFKEKVGNDQYDLLKTQCDAMEAYLNVLKQRIELDSIWDKCNSDEIKPKFDDDCLSREKVVTKAYLDCLREMYEKAQPSASYDEYVRKVNNGEIDEDTEERIYNRHYLSREEYEYIIDKYMSAYKIYDDWRDHCCLVKNFFINKRFDNEKAFKDTLIKIIGKYVDNDKQTEELSDKVIAAIIENIEECGSYYRTNREESGFRFSIGLGCSPTTNKETVINYWKTQGVDLDIVDRDPDTFYENDAYGENYDDE